MKKIVASVLLLALATALISCSSGSKMAPAVMPNIAGSWEFILASSTQPGYSTGLEAALKEGQALDTSGGGSGTYVYTGQISASGSQLNFVGFTPTGGIVFGGNCAPAADNTGNNLTGSISGLGGSVDFTFTENGNVFTVSAVLDASGQLVDSGTYTAQSGSGCVDSGTIVTGNIVPRISGTYTGHLLVNDNTDSATATLRESSSGTLTMNLVLTGADNTSLTLTGPVTGNSFSVAGTFQGTTISYYGYFEVLPSTPAIYLVNTATPSQKAGLLTVPPTP